MLTGFRISPVTRSVLVACMIAGTTVVKAEDEHWVQRIKMSGVVEVEYGSSEGFDGKKSSDVTVATVEVHLDAKVNEIIDAHVVLLHEEDETNFSVDAAFLDVALGPATVSVGAMGAPFGAFATHLLSDPLTMQLAETAETILQVGTELGPVHVAVYTFNGTTKEKGGDDVADQHGVHLAFVTEGKDSSLDIGIDYINNIADSDTIQGHIGTPYEVKSYVPAQIIHANLSFGNFHIIAEHLMADKFEATEVSFKGKGAEISATSLEVAFDMKIAGMDSTIALGTQSTEEALALGMPKSKTLAAISFGVAKYTALTFEYTSSSDYDVADGGTGKSANSFTAQLAVGF